MPRETTSIYKYRGGGGGGGGAVGASRTLLGSKNLQISNAKGALI